MDNLKRYLIFELILLIAHTILKFTKIRIPEFKSYFSPQKPSNVYPTKRLYGVLCYYQLAK